MLKFEIATVKGRKSADLIVIPFWKKEKKAVAAGESDLFKNDTSTPISQGDFSGKEGELLVVYSSEKKERRIALLGLGEKEKINVEKLRRAYSNLTKECRARKITEINVILPEGIEDSLRGVCEGILLTNYSFVRHKHSTEDLPPLLSRVVLLGASQQDLTLAKKYEAICEGVYLARDLVNGNADDVTPQFLADQARELSRKHSKIKTTTFDKQRIEREKLDLLLAVNRGSNRDPEFIIMDYQGDPKSKDRTILVGKGVTYDTGGLNLKPTGSMENMRDDMGGAATVLGTMHVLAKLGIKRNVIAVIPATENAIGPKSYKPGDVYSSYAKKSVEIRNTDAEGRLILADAIAYAVKNFKPSRIIDFATLTGAMVIALGYMGTGMMSNDDRLADALLNAGESTYERLWRFPLWEEYKDSLKSDIADLKNAGERAGGSIFAAKFLQEFVGDVPWAHCDIAATAFLETPRQYLPKYGTGVGVRLMIEFLEKL